MEQATLKRRLGVRTAATCEGAVGDYCYCRCLGVFHGINHKPMIDRENILRERKQSIDTCTCEFPSPTGKWMHEKTGLVFEVCTKCGGRCFVSGGTGEKIRKVASGARIIKSN